VSVAVAGDARTNLVLNRFRPLFSIAPMLKSSTATIMKRSRSSGSLKRDSSHTREATSDCIACSVLSRSPRRTNTCSRWSLPLRLVTRCSRATRSAATSAKRYEGFGNGSFHFAKWRPFSSSPCSTRLPLDSSTG
jgi:hypothetical protein